MNTLSLRNWDQDDEFETEGAHVFIPGVRTYVRTCVCVRVCVCSHARAVCLAACSTLRACRPVCLWDGVVVLLSLSGGVQQDQHGSHRMHALPCITNYTLPAQPATNITAGGNKRNSNRWHYGLRHVHVLSCGTSCTWPAQAAAYIVAGGITASVVCTHWCPVQAVPCLYRWQHAAGGGTAQGCAGVLQQCGDRCLVRGRRGRRGSQDAGRGVPWCVRWRQSHFRNDEGVAVRRLDGGLHGAQGGRGSLDCALCCCHVLEE
eukprot:613119-Pelagomonas_calceolata.AAC.3